jgi:VanZ family protein
MKKIQSMKLLNKYSHQPSSEYLEPLFNSRPLVADLFWRIRLESSFHHRLESAVDIFWWLINCVSYSVCSSVRIILSRNRRLGIRYFGPLAALETPGNIMPIVECVDIKDVGVNLRPRISIVGKT